MSRAMNKITSILNRALRKSYWFNNVAFPECRKFWTQKTFNLDLVNLGSSTGAKDFNYTGCGLKAANWAMSPQTFVGDYQILRNYYSYLKEGAMVLIPICPFSSLGGGDDYLADKYYTILNIISIPHASYKRKKQVMRIFHHPMLYYPLSDLFFAIGRLFKKYKDTMTEEELRKDAEVRIRNWMKEFSLESFTAPFTLLQRDLWKDAGAALNRLIEFCEERKLQPLLVLPPASKALQQKLTNELKERYVYSFVKEFNTRNIPFLDYFSDCDFEDSRHFRDSFLLNKEGATLFTNKILQEISYNL